MNIFDPTNASLVKFNVEMEFFVASRQGALSVIYIGLYVGMDVYVYIRTWYINVIAKVYALYLVCGSARIEAKFPWNAKSIYPLCVLPLPIDCPF